MAKSLKMIIEALLFSSDKPLTVKDIHDCMPDAEKSEIKNSIKILTHDYETLERSFILKEVAGGYQFRSKPEYGAYILRMFQKTPNRLSKATVETLAIIAYKQPILRSEVERLRGVDVGGIIRTLMEKGLVKIMGRKELPGRPLVYGTTKRFLEVFDLKDINSLPKLKEIKDFAADQYEPTIVNREGEENQEDGEVEAGEGVESPEEIEGVETVQEVLNADNVEEADETGDAVDRTSEETLEAAEEENGQDDGEESSLEPEDEESDEIEEFDEEPEDQGFEADEDVPDTSEEDDMYATDDTPEEEVQDDYDDAVEVSDEETFEEADAFEPEEMSGPDNDEDPDDNGTTN